MSDGKFVDPRELLKLFCLSKYFYKLSADPLLWYSLHKSHYSNKPFDQTVNWREEFITAWRYENTNAWEDTPEIRARRYHKTYQVLGKTVIHSQETTYLPIRTKYGYSSGVHYWEVIPHQCQHGAYNTYIGVGTIDLDMNWHLGRDVSGWGLRGFSGQFLHNNKVVAISKTFIDDTDKSNRVKSFYNDKPVLLRLDMDNCTLDYFVEGLHVLSYKDESWKVKTSV